MNSSATTSNSSGEAALGTNAGGTLRGATGGSTTGTGINSNTGVGAGAQINGPATTPPGLDGNLNQNSQTLPDATRGLDRAEMRSNANVEADGHDHASVKSKATVKARKNSRTRSNTTTQ